MTRNTIHHALPTGVSGETTDRHGRGNRSMPLRALARHAALFVLAAWLGAFAQVATAKDKLVSPLAELKAAGIEDAIRRSDVPRLSVQHRGLDITLAHFARYALYDITGKTSFPGEDPVFTYLGMLYLPDHWDHVKMFPLTHPGLAAYLGRGSKDRLAPSDLTQATVMRLQRLTSFANAMPEARARQLIDLPAPGGLPMTRERFAGVYTRVEAVDHLLQRMRQQGAKMDIETYRAWRTEFFPEGRHTHVKWAELDPAAQGGLEALYTSYLLGYVPHNRLIEYMVVLANGGPASAADMQGLINEFANVGVPDTSIAEAAGALYANFNAFDTRYENFAMAPVPESLDRQWVTIVEAAKFEKHPIGEASRALHNTLVTMYQGAAHAGHDHADGAAHDHPHLDASDVRVALERLPGDSAAFLDAAGSFPEYTSAARRLASYYYVETRPFIISIWLYLGAALCYLLAQRRGSLPGGLRTTATVLLLAAFLVHTSGIAARVAIMGRAPVSNIWESLVWVTWGGVLFGTIMEMRFRTVFTGLVTAALGFVVMVSVASMPNEMAQMQPLRAVLVSSWLTFHVLAITLSYAAFMLSAAFSLCYLVKDGSLLPPPVGGLLSRTVGIVIPSPEMMELFAYRAIQIGYPLLTWGIFSGAVWADHAWGRFWAWDPKETWSLITWLIYSAFLHMRLRHGLAGRYLAWMSLGGFACVLTTWLGVSYLKIFAGLHSYASG